MCTLQRSLVAIAITGLVALTLGKEIHAQLITSWEGSPGTTAGTPDGLGGPNGWIVPAGPTATLAIESDPGMIAGNRGVTDGDQSISIVFTGTNNGGGITHFDRPLRLSVPNPDPLYDLFNTVAATPALYKLRYDVTVDSALLPTFNNVGGELPFVAAGLFASSGSFGEAFNVVQFDPNDVAGVLTFNAEVNASQLNLVVDAGFYQLGFNINGNWDLNDDITLYIDNLRFDLVAPDLNEDANVDQADWAIFMANHKGDLSALTPEQQFLAGDLDGDGDNDFEDFVLFEKGFDASAGSGAFTAMLASVPEPSSMALVLLGVTTLLSQNRRRRMSGRRRSGRILTILLLVAAASALSSPGYAQQLNTFETDLEGWMNVNFGLSGVVLGQSTTGATEGSMAMSIQQPEDGFSWNAQVNYGGGSSGFNAWANAVDLGASLFELQFDVTYDTLSIPQGDPPTFTNVSIAVNSNAGWSQIDELALSNGMTDETLAVAVPLQDLSNLPANSGAAGFFQLNIGMNGDWGLDPATFYFDNFRLVQTVAEPRLTLTVDTMTGGVEISNTSGLAIDFDYYELTSAGDSLSPGGWSSLDSQNIDSLGAGPGQSWLEGGNPSSGDLSEAFLLGMTTLADAAAPISLGNAYDTSVNAQDILFNYRDPARPETLLSAIVEYDGALTADFEPDGDVDGADLATWELAFGVNANGDTDNDNDTDGADFLNWQRQFTGAAKSLASVAVVPEPSTCLLAVAGCVMLLSKKRRQRRDSAFSTS